jgi:hypothetical protein
MEKECGKFQQDCHAGDDFPSSTCVSEGLEGRTAFCSSQTAFLTRQPNPAIEGAPSGSPVFDGTFSELMMERSVTPISMRASPSSQLLAGISPRFWSHLRVLSFGLS